MVAKDIMTADPFTILTNEDPNEIHRIFLTKKLTAIPISDQNGNVLGILSEMGLVKVIAQFRADGNNKKIGSYTSTLEKAAYVEDTESIGNIVKALVNSPTHRVLVRNKAEKVIGIISPKDLLRMLAPSGAAIAKAAQPPEG